METLALELKVWEDKQMNLSKTLEELHSLASSEGWDLENRLESARSSLQTQLEQLMERENEMRDKESRFESVLIDLEEKKLNVESLQSLIDKKHEELEVKQDRYNAIQISIQAKEAEFDHVQKSISEAVQKLDLLKKSAEQKSEEAESKNNELDSIRGRLEKFEEAMQLKEKRLNVMAKSFEFCSKEFELKDKHLKQCKSSINDCDKEIKLKEKRLNSIQTSIVERSKKLELKEKRLDLVRKVKERNLELLRKSMKQSALEFKMKERKLESLVKEVELKEKIIKSKVEEIDLMHKKVNDCLMEVELKEKNLALLQGFVERRSTELETKESQFERRVDEFQSVQKECQAICALRKGWDVVESIRHLIQRGETIHAVLHICELKLTDKFAPIPLLAEYLEDAENFTTLFCREMRANEAKEKAKNKEEAALRAVMECMKVCNLESKFLSNKILKRIGVLEKKGQLFGSEAEQSCKRRKTSLSPGDQPPPRRGNFMSPCMSKRDNVWTKPPEGFVKLNFGFADRVDCGFLSIVARDHNAAVLAIWCRKIVKLDSLMGEALAAHGALSRAAFSGWKSIILEGDSMQVISGLQLQRSCDPSSSIFSIVSDSVAELGSFKCVIPAWIPREANNMARNVSQWAAGKNVQVGSSWMSVPSCLFSIFGQVSLCPSGLCFIS